MKDPVLNPKGFLKAVHYIGWTYTKEDIPMHI